MPRNASGTVTLPTNDSHPAAPRNVIRSSDFNELMADVTTELTDSWSRSGKGAALADLDMGGFDLLNVPNLATAAQGALADSALQPGTGVYRIPTFAGAGSVFIPAIVNRVFIEDRKAHFARVGPEPSHAMKFNNGGWWQLDEGTVYIDFFDSAANIATDAGPAITAALAYALLQGPKGDAIDFLPNGVYTLNSNVTFKRTLEKQTIINGNGALILAGATVTGYLFDSGNVAAAVFGYLLAIRNLTVLGRYNDATISFLYAKNQNGLVLDRVNAESFHYAIDLDSSFAVEIDGGMYRYIRQNWLRSVTSSMGFIARGVRVYDMLVAAAVSLTATNHNITFIGCTFEGGAGSCFHTTAAVSSLLIIGCYIEGFAANPLRFEATMKGFRFESWLGYNSGTQLWQNLFGAFIVNSTFAGQVTTLPTQAHGNTDVSMGINNFIDSATVFSFPPNSVTLDGSVTIQDSSLVGFFVDGNGMTNIQGIVSRSADGGIFQLPAYARPWNNMVFAIYTTLSSGADARLICQVAVGIDGWLTVFNPAGAGGPYKIALDAITFRAKGY